MLGTLAERVKGILFKKDSVYSSYKLLSIDCNRKFPSNRVEELLLEGLAADRGRQHLSGSYENHEIDNSGFCSASLGKTRSIQSSKKKQHITLGVIVHNEAGRYLERVLNEAIKYISAAVIVDDASTDNSVQVCVKALNDIPYKIIENTVSRFAVQYELRGQLWDEIVATDPKWVLMLDADEIFEDSFASTIDSILANSQEDLIYCAYYDFWDEEHYREDEAWRSHNYFRPYIMRYDPNKNYEWLKQTSHCGSFPTRGDVFKYFYSDIRVKHYGWLREEDRKAKYERNMKKDPEGKYEWIKKMQTLMDPNPNLVKWVE